MPGLVQLLQHVQNISQVVDTALPSLGTLGREAVQRAISSAATDTAPAARAALAVGSDFGVERVAIHIDPSRDLNSQTIARDLTTSAHPSMREDLARLSHVVEAKEEAESRRRREAFENVSASGRSGEQLISITTPPLPFMRKSANTQTRQPLMKF